MGMVEIHGNWSGLSSTGSNHFGKLGCKRTYIEMYKASESKDQISPEKINMEWWNILSSFSNKICLRNWKMHILCGWCCLYIYISFILFNCTFWDSVPDGSLQWSSSCLVCDMAACDRLACVGGVCVCVRPRCMWQRSCVCVTMLCLIAAGDGAAEEGRRRTGAEQKNKNLTPCGATKERKHIPVASRREAPAPGKSNLAVPCLILGRTGAHLGPTWA